VEGNGVLVDSNIVDQLFEITVSGVINVLEETMLQRGVLVSNFVVGDLIDHLCAEDVLVSEHIAYFAFVYGHTFFVCPSESFLLVSVPVLLVVVFFFRNFCKTLFKFIAGLVSIDILLNARTFVILNFVDQGLFFCVSESSHERHYTFELFLVFL